MVASRFEATPVPSKSSRVSRTELRWLYHQLPTAGIPPVQHARPSQTSVPASEDPKLEAGEVIDLTGDSDSDEPRNGLKSRHNHLTDANVPSNDDEHPSQLHTQNSSSSRAMHFSLPFRQRGPLNRKPFPPKPSSTPPQESNKRTSRDAHTISSSPEKFVAPTNKRKESESAEDEDAHSGNWPKRLRARRAMPCMEVGAGGTNIVDDPADIPMESIEGDHEESEKDDDESDSEEYEVERVIAEKKVLKGRRVHEYLLAWVGYEVLNWIPAKNCFCDNLIAQFRDVPRAEAVAKDLAAKELAEERVQRTENAVRTRVAKAPKVKHPITRGIGCLRNPRTGRFERRKPIVHDPIGRDGGSFENERTGTFKGRRSIIYDSQDDNDWAGIESDNESNRDVVPDNIPRNLEAETAEIPLKVPSPALADTPRKDSTHLLSKDPSPHLGSQPNSQPEDRVREVFRIHETPSDEDITLQENLRSAEDHSHRQRQTAEIIWIRDTPDVDDYQLPLTLPQAAVGFTSSKTEPAQNSNGPFIAASAPASIESRMADNAEAVGRIVRPPLPELNRVQEFEREKRWLADAAEVVTEKQQRVAEVEKKNPHASEATSRHREEDIKARKRSEEKRRRRAKSPIIVPKRRSTGKDEAFRRHAGRTKAEQQAAKERKRTEGAIEAEVRGNEGRLGALKTKVDNLLNDAWGDALVRAPPFFAASRVREGSVSRPAQAFRAAIEQEKSKKLARRANGPFRSEIHADLSRHHIKELVSAAQKSSEHTHNHPYGRRPEEQFGFSLSNENLSMPSSDTPMPSIET